MTCRSLRADKSVCLKAPKRPSELRLQNPLRKPITILDLDNCPAEESDCNFNQNKQLCPLMNKSGKRCDYIVIFDKNNEYLFVELKGKKILDACEQIEETIKKVVKNINISKPIKAFVVSTACPLPGTELQRLQLHFKKKYECSLIVKNRTCNHFFD